MTNNNIHIKNNTLNNTINTKLKIKLSTKGGKLVSNIIIPEIDPCEITNLNFSCADNSQYIPII